MGTLGKTLDSTIRRALTENWKKTKGDACIKLAHDKFTVGAQVGQMLVDAAKLPPVKRELIFQLGTNNWQRQGEFAPGSGILHASFHQTFNSMKNVKCFSIYPSKLQSDPDSEPDYQPTF